MEVIVMKVEDNKRMQLGSIAVQGCDISYYQGDVNFEKMKATGIKAVIIRAGYGTTIDKRFISYINAAIKAGLSIGVYWFIYAPTPTSSINNAQKCLEVIAPYKQYITCGVWADWEYDSDKRAGMISASTRSNLVEIFVQAIEAAGYEAGIYSNQDYIQSKKFLPMLIQKYPLWFAKYSATKGNYANSGKHKSPYLWQYSSTGKGSFYGVGSKDLDMNQVYIDLYPVVSVPPAEQVSKDPDYIKASDNPYIEPTRTIYYQPGRTLLYGDDVKWIQWHLWRFGLFLDKKGEPDASQIDGKWGQVSDKALALAQQRLGLLVDRKCGPLSREQFKIV